MNTIQIPREGESEIDDFLSPAAADAAQRVWQEWWRAGKRRGEVAAERTPRGRELAEARSSRLGVANVSFPD